MKEIAQRKGHAVLCLENKTEATAFMYFLRKELKRHQQDISRLSDDISSLSEIWDIPIPDMDAEIWIDATYNPKETS